MYDVSVPDSFIMLCESYTSVSRLINTEPSELLRLWLIEPITSESVWGKTTDKEGTTCEDRQCSGIFVANSISFRLFSPYHYHSCECQGSSNIIHLSLMASLRSKKVRINPSFLCVKATKMTPGSIFPTFSEEIKDICYGRDPVAI